MNRILNAIRPRYAAPIKKEIVYAQNQEYAPNPTETLDDTITKSTIFISIPSYRDSECAHTIYDCILKAAYPERIYFGVLEQNHPAEDTHISCLNLCISNHIPIHYINKHIRVNTISHLDAKGPVYARSRIEQTMYNQEDFYLMIDSHTLFTPDWDIECIRQLLLCKQSPHCKYGKPVLSCSPLDYDRITHQMPSLDQPATFLRFHSFDKKTGFINQQRGYFTTHPHCPVPSMLWAAGFSFSYGHMIQNVPYDPSLHFVFIGEELSMAVRLYTHGYDVFAPNHHLVFSHTDRSYRPKFWQLFHHFNSSDAEKRKTCIETDEIKIKQRKELERQGNQRIHQLILGNIPCSQHELYGTGSYRTVSQFQETSGLDFIAQQDKHDIAKYGFQHPSIELDKQYKSTIN